MYRFCRLIRNFSIIISPVMKSTQKIIPLKWFLRAEAAVTQLKTISTSSPILVYPNTDLSFVVEVDALDSCFTLVKFLFPDVILQKKKQ